jgi:predicted dithiol-disulfide oxidoreductase (DUF899 family)
MAFPQVVSRDEWREARAALMVKEKELTRARDALSAERRALPVVRVDKEYVFEGPFGKSTLLDLFEGRRQLIVYHAMFGPDWDQGCVGCSFLIDNLGDLSHLHAAGTTLALVSRAALPKLQGYAERMGWSPPWYSSFESDFNDDYEVTVDGAERSGLSVFLRDGGVVHHAYTTYARGTEILLNTFNLLDYTPLGRQEETGVMNWVRRHDEY